MENDKLKIPDILKMKQFTLELFNGMRKNPCEVFDNFILKWPKFSQNERNILFNFIGSIYLKEIEDRIQNGKAPTEEETLYWLSIDLYMKKPIEDGVFIDEEDFFPKLVLRDKIFSNQIAKIFRELRENGDIISSYDDIADAIALIFPINRNTAYKALTEKERTQKANKLI